VTPYILVVVLAGKWVDLDLLPVTRYMLVVVDAVHIGIGADRDLLPVY
jgi:hypothetical protein